MSEPQSKLCLCWEGFDLFREDWLAYATYAVDNHHFFCLRALLDSKYDPKNKAGGLDLFFYDAMLHSSDPEIIDIFLDYGDADFRRERASRALLHAVSFQYDIERIKILLKKGASTYGAYATEEDFDGCPGPLHCATTLEVAKVLVENGAIVDDYDDIAESPLDWRVSEGNFEVAKYLLEQGADANHYGIDRAPPLHRAINRGDERMVDLLVENGADLESESWGETCLLAAIRVNEWHIVLKLLEYGADAKATSLFKALHQAVSWDQAEGHRLESIAPILTLKQREMEDVQPSYQYKFALVSLLVEHGADPDAEYDGETPLSLALSSDDAVLVQALLKKGASNLGPWKERIFAESDRQAVVAFRAHSLKSQQRKIRGIVRFIIVAARYRESFYRYKYAALGAQTFEKHKEQLNENVKLSSASDQPSNGSQTCTSEKKNVRAVRSFIIPLRSTYRAP